MKKLKPSFSYLNYELVQVFVTFNRTNVTLVIQVNE